MDALNDAILFLLMVVAGALLEVVVSELHYRLVGSRYKENHFTFGKYIFLLLFPLFAVAFFTNRLGSSLLTVFFVFSIVGTAVEWLIGFCYHRVVGQRLWTYHRYSLTKYTSLLSMPLWGLGGVLFWLLARAFAQ